MEFVKRAAIINEQGAAFCASGDMQNGFECFRNALRVLSTVVESFDETRNFAGRTSETYCLHKLSTTRSCSRRHDSPTAFDSQPYFVFKEAILFNADAAGTTTSHLALFLAVIEFNMALTFHLQSFRVGRKGPMVTKALNLYNFCLQQANHASDCSEASNVLVAALSNKAQIMNQEFGCYQELQEMQHGLVKGVAVCHAKPGLFTAEEVEEFLLNIVIIRDLKFASAA